MKKTFFLVLVCTTASIFLSASHVTSTSSSLPPYSEEEARYVAAAEDQSASAGIHPLVHSPSQPFACLTGGPPPAVKTSRRAISSLLLADAEAPNKGKRIDDEAITNYDGNEMEEGIPGMQNNKRYRNKHTQTWARNTKQRLRIKLEVIRSEPYGRDKLTETLTRAGKPLTVRWTSNDARNLALLEANGIAGTGKIKNLVRLARMANPRFTAQPNPEEVFRAGADQGAPNNDDSNDEMLLPGVSVQQQQQISLADEVFRERLAFAAPYGRPNPFGLDATLVARLGSAGLHHLEDLHHHVSVIATRKMRQDVLSRLDGDPDAAPSTKSADEDFEGEDERIDEDPRRKQHLGRELSYLRKRVTQKLQVQAKPASNAGRPRMWTTNDAADLRRLLNAGATKVLQYVEEAQRANPHFRVEGVEPKMERMKRKRAKIEAFFEKLNASHRMTSDGTLVEARPQGAEEERDRGKHVAVQASNTSSSSSAPDSFSSFDSPPWREKSVSPPRRPYHPRQMRISRAFISSRHPSPLVQQGRGQHDSPSEQLPARPVLLPFRQVHPPPPSSDHQTSPPYLPRHRALLTSSMLESSCPRPPQVSRSFVPLHAPLLPPIRPFTSFPVEPAAKKSSVPPPQRPPAHPVTPAIPSRRQRRHDGQHETSSPPAITAPTPSVPSASTSPLRDNSVPPTSSSSWADNSTTPEWLQYLLNLQSP